MRNKFYGAFFFLLILTILTQVLVLYFTLEQRDNSRVINLAGRQRMLSQKMALQLFRFKFKGEKDFSQKAKIQNTGKLLKQTHFDLKNGSITRNVRRAFTPHIYKELELIESSMKKMKDHVACVLRDCSTEKISRERIIVLFDNYLSQMHHVVSLMEDYSKRQVVNLGALELFVCFLIIFAMLYQFFWVMIPINKELIENINKLDEQKKIAEHASKLATIGELAAGVGHEINNPLTIMKLHVKQLKKCHITTNQDDCSESIISNLDLTIDRISVIVDGLRSFSRSVDEPDYHYSVHSLISNTVKMVKGIMHTNGISIDYNFDNESINAEVSGNQGKLQQVLLNLINNGKDALEGRLEKSISISSKVHEDQLIIELTDNGIGMKKEVINSIFSPFFTTKEIGKGTGIGLSICYKIISNHSGGITVRSEPGLGTTFKINLPCQKKILQINGKKQESFVSKGMLYGLKAIVVDDEPAVLELMSLILSDVGVEVSEFSTGKWALEEFKKNPNLYDMVLSDVRMPNMEGPELIKKMKENLDQKVPKFYFMTGGTGHDLFENEANKCLVDEIFFKPFDENELIEVIFSDFNRKISA